MLCPACSHSLDERTYRGIVIDVCPRCKGVFFTSKELGTFIRAHHEDDRVQERPLTLDRADVAAAHDPHQMKPSVCPHCAVAMHPVNYAYDSNILIDHCAICNGIWIDTEPKLLSIISHSKGNSQMQKLGNAIAEEVRLADQRKLKVAAAFDSAVALTYPGALSIPLSDTVSSGRVPIVTLSIIASCVLVFGLSWFSGMGDQLIQIFGMTPAEIVSRGAYVTLVTYVFVYTSVSHLVFNMLFLWIFGDNIEESFGPAVFAVFFFLSGIIGGLAEFAIDPSSRSLIMGSSAAISGIMGAYLVLYRQSAIQFLIFFPVKRTITIPAVVYFGIWVALQFGGLINGDVSVAYVAHLAGFTFGATLAILAKQFNLIEDIHSEQ